MNKLDEDQEFISKFSKSYHSRYLFITKTLQSKLKIVLKIFNKNSLKFII